MIEPHDVTNPIYRTAGGYAVLCSCGWSAEASYWSLALEYARDHVLAERGREGAEKRRAAANA